MTGIPPIPNEDIWEEPEIIHPSIYEVAVILSKPKELAILWIREVYFVSGKTARGIYRMIEANYELDFSNSGIKPDVLCFGGSHTGGRYTYLNVNEEYTGPKAI